MVSVVATRRGFGVKSGASMVGSAQTWVPEPAPAVAANQPPPEPDTTPPRRPGYKNRNASRLA